MVKLNTIIWKRISSNVEVSIDSLAIFRIIVALWILFFHFETFSWIGDLPDFLMKEQILSIANTHRSYPPITTFYILDFIRLTSILFLLLGIKARIFGIVFFVITIFCKSYQYSLGSIEHDFLLFFLIFLMSFTNWGTTVAIFPDRKDFWLRDKFSLAILAISIVWGMFTAGFMKGINWVDLDIETSGILRWVTEGYYSLERNRFLTEHVLSMDWRVLEILDYLAVCLELSPIIFLLYNRKAWLTWILIAVGFHLANIFLLNINFMSHFLVYAVFIDWGKFRSLIEKILENYKNIIMVTIVLVFILRFYDVFFGSNNQNLIFYLSKDFYLAHLFFGIAMWIVLGILLIREINGAHIKTN